ncbi:MAG: hypothetical protein A2760_02700 [Candidatus Doudnabacteria bacterium RIFCSPHIGHO2_01_FULL_50_67]|nr:MAG: hypothetical protein A2760_02700 [Candidatus Doudnabacteria bacterium RIFCSPHIGHO2_01_FULL_50_67]
MATSPALTEQKVVQGDVIPRVSRILNAMEDVLLRLPGATFETSWRPIGRETPPASIKIRVRFRPDLSLKAEFHADGSADLLFPLCSKPPSHLRGISLEGQPTAEVVRHLVDLVSAETFGYAMGTVQLIKDLRQSQTAA